MPGYVNKTWFKASRTGTFYGQCAELCGAGHADMRARVRVVTPEQYTRFVEQRKDDIEASQTALAQQRKSRDQLEEPDAAQAEPENQ